MHAMDECRPPLTLPAASDLETVLAAWHAATVRLEQTHAALRAEVRRLSDELETKNRELARKNRLADLGQMASHVAHEVRNSLVPVTLYMSLLRRRLSDDPGSLDVLDKMEEGLLALDTTVNDLLSFSAQRDPCAVRLDLRDLVDGVLAAVAPQLHAQAIEVTVDVPPGTLLLADHDMLRRAVLNLVLNALDAMPEGGELVITSWQGSQGLELEVADSGPGLSEEARRRAFEPFFSTKPGGTGLGLAVVYRTAEAHGGDVHVLNCPEGGAAFTLRIPRRAREAAA
jgi:signal transduction histidine kinase